MADRKIALTAEPVANYIESFRDPRHSTITLEHLLRMSSGLGASVEATTSAAADPEDLHPRTARPRHPHRMPRARARRRTGHTLAGATLRCAAARSHHRARDGRGVCHVSLEVALEADRRVRCAADARSRRRHRARALLSACAPRRLDAHRPAARERRQVRGRADAAAGLGAHDDARLRIRRSPFGYQVWLGAPFAPGGGSSEPYVADDLFYLRGNGHDAALDRALDESHHPARRHRATQTRPAWDDSCIPNLVIRGATRLRAEGAQGAAGPVQKLVPNH